MQPERFLTVHYLDGTTETYSFPKQAKDQYELANKMQSIMNLDRITMDVDGILSVIPLTAVKRLEFSPTPAALPDGIITGAKLLDL